MWFNKRKIIVNRLLKRDGELFKFLLIKRGTKEYTLSAVNMRKRYIAAYTKFKTIPFQDDQGESHFESSLLFGFDGQEIT